MRLLALVFVLGCGGSSGGDPNSCHRTADCQGGAFCGAYTLEPLCHGMMDTDFSHMCQGDADCATLGPNQICDNELCIAPRGGAQPVLHCRVGCVDPTDCLPGEMCDADHRCAALVCTPATDCGANDTCTNGICAARACAHDTDCDGYCVTGFCSPSPGTCNLAVP